MTIQGELFRVPDKTDISEKLAVMESWLHGSHVPFPVEKFDTLYGWSRRTCRAIVTASEGRIIATESGYILTRNATPEQFDEANGRIYSQGKAMLRRALKERAVRHRIISSREARAKSAE